MEFKCTVEPHYEDPAFQHITITALSNEDEACTDEAENDPRSMLKEDGIPYETVLGRAELFRYYEPDFRADDFPNYAWQIMDGQSADLEKIARLATHYGHRVKYQSEDQEYDFYERCSGFLIIDRIKVEPFARGHTIGEMILREIRQHHAGQLIYCALTAEPYDYELGPERDAMQKGLISWYKRQDGMHFRQLAPRKNPEFLMAAWDGRDIDYSFPDIQNTSALIESWKASQHNASQTPRDNGNS